VQYPQVPGSIIFSNFTLRIFFHSWELSWALFYSQSYAHALPAGINIWKETVRKSQNVK